MPDCCSWLSRSACCRRQSQHAYIYLYSPTMANSSSSTTSHCCLICILFALCLAFIVILAAVVIYHLNSTTFPNSPASSIATRFPTTKKRQLPDYVNINIDPCENFYDFVCDNLTQKKSIETYNNQEEYEQKWIQIRHNFHDKLMIDINNQTINNRNDYVSSISHFYQLCEKISPELLLDEVERYFANLTQQEPYRSYLTLFNQTNKTNKLSSFNFFTLHPNPFFKIQESSTNSSTILRINRHPLPSALSIFPNITILNQTAFRYLLKFDSNYQKFLSNENHLIKAYEQEYNQDSLIIKRILTYKNYHQCLSSLTTNNKNGLEKLIELLNYFLHTRLENYNTQSFDKDFRILDKINDNHTLVERLENIKLNLKTIERIILLNNTNTSCIINLLEQLLDKQIQSNEFLTLFNIKFFNTNQNQNFISNDWPYLIMLYEHLLKNTTYDTLINFAFFDYYRQFIYPYYQPHLQHQYDISIDSNKHSSGYTYQIDYPNLSCHIQSCFDIFNCYHPSLFNQLVEIHNQTLINQTRILTENLINRFRLLTEQSDNLFLEEKRQILNELNQIQIHIGYISSNDKSNDQTISSSNQFSSYIDYVQYYSSIPYDQEERSYFIEPIYYPLNHTLFLPYSFLNFSKTSVEYHLIKLLLKIFRLNIQSNPYHIECLLKSFEDDTDLSNVTKFSLNDEHIIYLLLRTKFLLEKNINLDEYLWPFMSANFLMKRFLIDYTANNYCRNFNGYNLYGNNTYFMDDIHLIFDCQEASSIKQSKCTVI